MGVCGSARWTLWAGLWDGRSRTVLSDFWDADAAADGAQPRMRTHLRVRIERLELPAERTNLGLGSSSSRPQVRGLGDLSPACKSGRLSSVVRKLRRGDADIRRIPVIPLGVGVDCGVHLNTVVGRLDLSASGPSSPGSASDSGEATPADCRVQQQSAPCQVRQPAHADQPAMPRAMTGSTGQPPGHAATTARPPSTAAAWAAHIGSACPPLRWLRSSGAARAAV